MKITKKQAYISNELEHLKHSLTFMQKNKSIFSATSILSCSPMAYNSTASLEKLLCTDYADFGKCQDRFRQFPWSRNDSNYLHVKLKEFRKDDKKEFRLVQNLTMGEADFNKFMRLRNQLVNAAQNFAREDYLSPVLIPTLSKDINFVAVAGNLGGKVPVVDNVLSSHEQELHPTTSLDENCIGIEFQTDWNFHVDLRQTYLALKLKLLRRRGYDTYNSKEVKKEQK